MEIVSKLLRTLTKVFSDANLFSNLVTIDLLSELYLMVPLLLLVTNSNRLIRYWITATGAGARCPLFVCMTALFRPFAPVPGRQYAPYS